MTFFINAWLDRAEPSLQICNRATNEVIAQFDRDTLQYCLDHGEFCIQELCSTEVTIQQELIRDLLLAHMTYTLQSKRNTQDYLLEAANQIGYYSHKIAQ